MKKGVVFAVLSLLVVAYIFAVVDLEKTKKVPEIEISGGQRGLATTTITLAGEIFTVELAQTHEERVMGLSGRENLAENAGMLFVFSESDYHGIWMKDMRFPIDILWLDREGVVVSLKENVAPKTFPVVFKPSRPARFVLEAASGTVRRLAISLGESVPLPSQDGGE